MWFFLLVQRLWDCFLLPELFTSHAMSICDHARALSQIGTV